MIYISFLLFHSALVQIKTFFLFKALLFCFFFCSFSWADHYVNPLAPAEYQQSEKIKSAFDSKRFFFSMLHQLFISFGIIYYSYTTRCSESNEYFLSVPTKHLFFHFSNLHIFFCRITLRAVVEYGFFN